MPGFDADTDHAWMAQRLDDAGLSGFDHANAMAMFSRGTLIGTALCKLWESLSGD